MAAPSTARRAPARSSRRRSARRPATPARARRPAAATPGHFVPVAVGRTAVAVASLPDSGFVVRLTRGRLWIGALAALLVGIVALNVLALNLSSSTSETARAVEALERQGSALRAELAREQSGQRIKAVAGALGLLVPEPGSIRYLRPSPGDAAEAARRLRAEELVAAAPAAETAPIAPPPAGPEEAAPEVSAEPPAPAAEPAPAPEAAGAGPGTVDEGGRAVAAGGVASP